MNDQKVNGKFVHPSKSLTKHALELGFTQIATATGLLLNHSKRTPCTEKNTVELSKTAKGFKVVVREHLSATHKRKDTFSFYVLDDARRRFTQEMYRLSLCMVDMTKHIEESLKERTEVLPT